jgi:hypothetical protein
LVVFSYEIAYLDYTFIGDFHSQSTTLEAVLSSGRLIVANIR